MAHSDDPRSRDSGREVSRPQISGRRRALTPEDIHAEGIALLAPNGNTETVLNLSADSGTAQGMASDPANPPGAAPVAPVPQTVPRPGSPARSEGGALEIVRPTEPPMRMPPPLPPAMPPMAEWRAGGALIAGVLALVLLVGGLGVWSTQAQLSSAVVTSGMINVETNRQVVQHPDGGVVGAILVKDGDTVKAGDVLIQLDGTRLQSERTIVEGQLREIAARQARLEAERDGKDSIVFPQDLQTLAKTDAETRRQIDGEDALFAARMDALGQQTSLLDEQNAQIGNRIEGLDAQMASLISQIALMDSELEDQQRLLAQKLTQSARVLELQRERARMTGQMGQLKAETAELRGKLAENGIIRLQLATQRQEEAVTALRDLQFRQIELVERQLSLSETLSRLDVRAPVDGVVYNSQIFAVQSVVQAAQPILYIVPQDQPLVISARVNAINIDEVFVGQEASLKFSAFDQRKIPDILGEVAQISADALRDEATGANYYTIEVTPRPGEMTKLGDHTLLPGMPVEAFLKTGEHTVLSYLLRPFMSFFDRAFRE
jgi:HlyD family type I secretion membrane fusion protein